MIRNFLHTRPGFPLSYPSEKFLSHLPVSARGKYTKRIGRTSVRDVNAMLK